MKKLALKIIFFFSVFIIGFSVWYSPVLFKGYAPAEMLDPVLLAKNLDKTGFYSMESERGVFLSSSLIKEEGHIATLGNKLTAYLYAGLFKLTGGALSYENLILFSIFLNSLTLLIFTFLVYHLFGFRLSGLFALIYVLMPFNWSSVYSVGAYEFSVFFVSLFFLFFLVGKERKYSPVFLVASGVFLTLSALAREALFLLIPVLLVYLWFSRQRKIIISVFVPIVLILAVFYLPSFFKDNAYSNLFFARNAGNQRFVDFNFYGHLYPDPYLYHFEREKFLSGYSQQINQVGFLQSMEIKKVLANMGERSMTLLDRFLLGIILVTTHFSRFLSFELIGGPFILFFALLGFLYLKKRREDLFKFFIYWILGVVFLMSFIALVSRSHLEDFNWLIPFLAALGIFFLADLFNEKFNFSEKSKFLFFCFLSFVILWNMVLADHVVFGKVYDNQEVPKLEMYAKKIKEAGINDNNVIAFGLHNLEGMTLNYLTDKSIVILTPDTMKKLVKENQLKKVFEFFSVKYIMGYDDELSKSIVSSSGVINIASDSLKIEQLPVSAAKSLIMNLIR